VARRAYRYAAEDVAVDATTLAPGVLVLTDQFFPGWRPRSTA
jgi:hypothetical protein